MHTTHHPTLLALVGVGLACSARPASLPSCGVSEPIAFVTSRRFPLEQSSRDSAQFQLLIRGTNLANATAHICVIAGTDIVFHDTVPTSSWGPPVPDFNVDSIVRYYGPRFFDDGLRAFPSTPVRWGYGKPDPYLEWESDDPYSALARGLEREGAASVDTAEIIGAVREFSSRGSAMLTFRNDPEGSATIVWWPSQKRFVRLIM